MFGVFSEVKISLNVHVKCSTWQVSMYQVQHQLEIAIYMIGDFMQDTYYWWPDTQVKRF